MRTRIENVRLVQDGQIRPAVILVNGEKVEAVLPAGEKPEAEAVIDGGGRYLSHGFVDIHTHGGGGHDFMDATEEAYLGAAKMHASHGTTGLAVTTLAASKEEILESFAVYERAKGKSEGARLLGIHLEGPYLSPAQSGAQDPKYIRTPKREEYEEIVNACPDILRWTIAPEVPGALELADFLRERGILPSMGHTDATYEQVKEALPHGFNHVTHLYSATSTIIRVKGFRHPGVLESAYLLDDLTVEIIADGCHLPAPLLQMVYRFIGPKRTALITDSMRGAGMPEGESILGSLKNGQKVVIEDGVAKLLDRSAFAGSVATTDRLVRNMVELAGASLPDAVRMATETPARILGKSDALGRVAVGRNADLVIFDSNIRIAMTMVGGKVVYQEK